MKQVMQQACEWMFIFNAFACVVTMIAANATGIVQLFHGSLFFFGAMLAFYIASRVLRC